MSSKLFFTVLRLFHQFKYPLTLTIFIVFTLLYLIPATSSDANLYNPPSDNWRYDENIQTTVVIPAYHEKMNMRPLVKGIFEALSKPSLAEVVIVDDDSQDGTEKEIEQLRKEKYNVHLIIRKKAKGLSSAVLRGMEFAKGAKIVVMDADLQHPVKSIDNIIVALDKSPMALATRYGGGSISNSWPMHRRIISWGARLLARPLVSVSDPMTGFFGITKKQFLQSRNINTTGFKIALELMLKSTESASSTFAEVPYSFASRSMGSSKLGTKTSIKYLGQLVSLYLWRYPGRFPVLLTLLSFTCSTILFNILQVVGLLLGRKDPRTLGRVHSNYKLKSDA